MNDCAHGLGMLLKKNGKIKVGKWERGTFVKSEKLFKSNLEAIKYNSIDVSSDSNEKHYSCDKMFPLFNPDGSLTNGLCWVEYSNQTLYIGEIKNGLRNGEGALGSKSEGVHYEGKWKDNMFDDTTVVHDELVVPISFKYVDELASKEMIASIKENIK